jgi:hypothetical protein
LVAERRLRTFADLNLRIVNVRQHVKTRRKNRLMRAQLQKQQPQSEARS